jgi:hypothetical protein
MKAAVPTANFEKVVLDAAMLSVFKEKRPAIIVGSDPRSLAVGESKWDAKQISETFHSVLQQT